MDYGICTPQKACYGIMLAKMCAVGEEAYQYTVYIMFHLDLNSLSNLERFSCTKLLIPSWQKNY